MPTPGADFHFPGDHAGRRRAFQHAPAAEAAEAAAFAAVFPSPRLNEAFGIDTFIWANDCTTFGISEKIDGDLPALTFPGRVHVHAQGADFNFAPTPPPPSTCSMQFARVDRQPRQAADPDLRGHPASCELCGRDVRPYCGQIRAWHWRHVALGDCDPWYETETAWHRQWKERFPEDSREVIMPPHRADVRCRDLVLELQHSFISPIEVQARETFYGKMVWLFDASRFADNLTSEVTEQDPVTSQVQSSFSWYYPRPHIRAAKAPVFLDVPESRAHRRAVWHIFDFGSHAVDFALSYRFGYCQALTPDQFAHYVLTGEYPFPQGPFLPITADYSKRPWPSSIQAYDRQRAHNFALPRKPPQLRPEIISPRATPAPEPPIASTASDAIAAAPETLFDPTPRSVGEILREKSRQNRIARGERVDKPRTYRTDSFTLWNE